MAQDPSLAARPGIRPRLLSFGKTLAFLALAFIGALAATAAARGLFDATLLELAQGGVGMGIARALLLLIGTVVLPTALMLRASKEPFDTSGWASAGAARHAGWGLATGFGLVAGIAGLLSLLGAMTFSLAITALPEALLRAGRTAILWLLLAAGEEGLNRGYALTQLSRAISFWPAAFLSSALFLSGHAANAGETTVGIAATGLFGLALAYSRLRTGTLWFALGFHAAWNFAQSFVFGFPNSGGASPGRLLSSQVTGSPWLTGGTAGPEGSLLAIPALVVLVAIVRRIAAAGSKAQ
ncbi:MAG: lysostaphin resistance A-like protein [Novosphingobium sp.]